MDISCATLDLNLSDETEAFRLEVQEFLKLHLPPRLRRGARLTPTVFAEPDICEDWQRILERKGWLGYCWPAGYGGTGWSPVQRYIFESECARAHAPELPALSLKLLGPVLHRFATASQKASYLPRILSGEDYWCQGFSEPGAGSDLASLQTRAVNVGGQWVVNGSKLWTTHAHFANRMFCLARTCDQGKAQAGISFFLLDMKQPGISVRPIENISGDHEVNAVFLDDAVATDIIGSEGEGWTIAKFLLQNERGGSCHAPVLIADLIDIRAAAEAEPDGSGGRVIDDVLFASDLAEAEIGALALEVTELRIIAEMMAGRLAGPHISLVKLIASDLRQDVSRLAMRLYAYAGLQLSRERPLYGDAAPPPVYNEAAQVAAAKYLNTRAWTVFGGSNEIQKNIIASTVLSL